MKTKKHRDSFQTDFFVDIDKFIGMVADRVWVGLERVNGS